MLKCRNNVISKLLGKLKEIKIGKFNAKIMFKIGTDEMVMRTTSSKLVIELPDTVDREPIDVWNAGQKLYTGLDPYIKVDLADNTRDVIIKGNIISINLANNQLYSLNIDKSTSLMAIHCNTNQLFTLNTNNNVNLRNLNCSYNQLSSLNIDNNINLGYLDCCNNQLTKLNINNNVHLKYFYCSNNNKLSVLNIDKNINLQILYLQNNYLTLDVIINILKAIKKIEKIDNSYGSKQCYLANNKHTDFTQPPELVEALNAARASSWNVHYRLRKT